MMASCVGAHHSFCTLKIGKKERCVRGDVDRKSNPANPAEISKPRGVREKRIAGRDKKKATNRKTYHLRHDEIVLSYTRVRGFQSVLGYSLLVFVKKRRNAFFLMTTKNVFFFRGEFCLNKISIGKLEIHLHFQSTLR